MKLFRTLPVIAGLLASALCANAQTFAPSTLIGNTLLTATLVSSTGGANADGTFTDLFSVNGMDYSVSTAGALSLPAPFTYASTGANTGVITESTGTVTLSFTSVSGGTFVASYSNGTTQSGTFTLQSLGVPTALNSLVMGNSLYNFSNLMHIDAGTSSTAGFVIGGTTPITILVRATGPALTQFGVTGALATPTLTLTSSKGAVIATDTGWNNSSSLSTAFSEAGAFSYAAGSADSAVVMTLAPGSYTVQVGSSVAANSGYVLLEVYVVN
jgi:hypothetical protein